MLSTLPAVRRGRAWPPSSLPASVPGRASRAVEGDEVALDRGPPRRGARPAGRAAPQWPGCASTEGEAPSPLVPTFAHVGRRRRGATHDPLLDPGATLLIPECI